MRIDEGGSDDEAAGSTRLDRGDDPVRNRDDEVLVDPLDRVDDATLERQRVGAAVSAEEASRHLSGTADRTGPVVSRS